MSEIEFRPITKGLGFHKNKLKIDEDALKSIQWNSEVELPEIDFQDDEPSESSLSAQSLLKDHSLEQTVVSYRKPKLDLLSDELDVDKVRKELQKKALLSKTLPRDDIAKESKETIKVKIEPENRKIDLGIDQIRKVEQRVELEKVELTTDERELMTKAHSGNLFAGIIDFIVTAGVMSLFFSSLLIVTELDVYQIVGDTYQDPMTQLSVALILIASSFLYVVITRSFFGMTLGDWALDIQLGKPEEQKSTWYPVKVSVRFVVNILFGVILLPVLSLLFRKDLLGSLVGLSLYEYNEFHEQN